MPDIGLGTYRMPEGKVTENAVKYAISAGYMHIDTASYYDNETSVGKALKDSNAAREDVFITTKLWNTEHDNVRKAFLKSLKRLGTDYVDQYLIHWPVEGKRQESWRELERIYDDGLAKSIGVSNYTISHLKQLLDSGGICPAVNQVEFHPFLFQKELLDYCESKDIRVVSYCPLVRAKRMSDERILEISKRLGHTPAQILIRWGLEQGLISIPKSENKSRIEENIGALEFSLAKGDMRILDDMNEGLRLTWDPSKIP